MIAVGLLATAPFPLVKQAHLGSFAAPQNSGWPASGHEMESQSSLPWCGYSWNDLEVSMRFSVFSL
jgi:hypothetical protein